MIDSIVMGLGSGVVLMLCWAVGRAWVELRSMRSTK